MGQKVIIFFTVTKCVWRKVFYNYSLPEPAFVESAIFNQSSLKKATPATTLYIKKPKLSWFTWIVRHGFYICSYKILILGRKSLFHIMI